MLVYFSLEPSLHMYTALMRVPMTWSHQLRSNFKTTTGNNVSQTRDFNSVWTSGSFSVPILSTPHPGNTDLRVTSSSTCPAGCTSTFYIAGNSFEVHRILFLFIFSFFFLPPSLLPMLVLAVTENNVFVGGFKMSDIANKHRCSLCSKAGNSIKEAEIKE